MTGSEERSKVTAAETTNQKATSRAIPPSNMDGEDFPPLDPEAAPFVLFRSKKKRGKKKKKQQQQQQEEEEETTSKEAFYSVSRDKAFMETMVELERTVASAGGTYLWAPVTRQRIELPALEEEANLPGPRRGVCVLSHAPADPDCTVLLAHLEAPAFWFCRPGRAAAGPGNRWARHDYAGEGVQIARIAAAGGEFSVDLHHSLATLRLSPSPPAFEREAVAHAGWMDGYHAAVCRLVGCAGGELFKVVVFSASAACRHVEAVRVYGMDFAGKTWRWVTDLGDRAFFLDRFAWGASCSAKQFGLDPGCVYFLSGAKGIIVISRPNEGSHGLWTRRGGLDADRAMHSFLMPSAPWHPSEY
ncbi:hypothetical protein ACP4OV_026032 [Aristida adscensionis]